MDFDVLFAGVAVSDFKAGQTCYERFFARPRTSSCTMKK